VRNRGKRGQVRVGVIGLDHVHGLVLAVRLWQAGATIAAFHAEGHGSATRDKLAMRVLGPRARSRPIDAILEDPSIDLIVTAAIPRDRGDLAVRALRSGKHVVADKPGVTTLDGLAEIDRAVRETGNRWWVMFGERMENRAVAEACNRARLGDLGRVVSVLGLGPHRMGAAGRPAWFWDPEATGGILVDIGSHQADQFLSATGAGTAEVLSAQVGNAMSPRHPAMQDVGQMVLAARTAEGDPVQGTHRVDYLSPKGLPTWGDGRLQIVGTEGTIEARTNIDIGGRKGKEHLLLVDQKGVHRLDARATPGGDWARRLVADLVDGSDTFVPYDHVHAVCDLTLRAQAAATTWGEPPASGGEG
jgi:predicted dehydrogenase